MKTPLSLLLVFLAAAGAGWLAGPHESGTPSNTSGADTVPKGKSAERVKGLNRSSGMTEEVQRLLTPVREARNDAERMRATVELARSLPLAELKEWYLKGWFGMPGSIEADAFARITRDRWIAGQPQEAMTFLLTRSDPQGVNAGMREWARLNPAAALDFVVGCKDAKQSNGLLWAALQSLGPDTDPSLIMATLPKLGGAPFSTVTLRPLIALAATKLSPEQLAAQSAAWPTELRRAVQGAMDGAAFQRDPAAAVASLSSASEAEARRRLIAALDSGIANAEAILSHADELPQPLLKQILGERPAWMVNRDPKRWLDEDLSGFGLSADKAWSVRDLALRKLSEQDPAVALAVLRSISEGTPEQHGNFVAGIIQKLAATDLVKAEAMLAGLRDPLEIELARKRIDAMARQKIGQENSVILNLDQRIDRTFSNEFDGTSSQSSMENWSLAEGAAAVNKFRQLPPERQGELAKQMQKRNFQGLQSAVQGEMIAWLIANRAPSAREDPQSPVVDSVSFVANQWAEEDPIAASRWAQSLPSGVDRSQALGNVARKWSESEPAAVREWMVTLPEEDRSAIETGMKRGW